MSLGFSFHRFPPLPTAWLLLVVGFSGCASTRMSDTSRTGVEQILLSNAVDQSLGQVDFSGLAGRAVFVDERFLDSVDKKYIVASIRQRAFQSGARLVDRVEDAELVVEAFSGALGTDRSEGYLGVPALSVPGPVPVELPEVKLLSQTTQHGTAKIGLTVYDAQTRAAVSPGGLARARSHNSNWSVLGIGPINTGSVRNELSLARRGSSGDTRIALAPMPPAGETPPITARQPAAPFQPLPPSAPLLPGLPPGIPPPSDLVPSWPLDPIHRR